MLASKPNDGGSAVLDFLAFGIPGIFILVIASQLVYGSYLSTISYDAALEGVAVAALADGSDSAAVQRSKQVIGALTGIVIEDVNVGHEVIGDQGISAVSVKVGSPVLGLGLISISQTAEAIDEPR